MMKIPFFILHPLMGRHERACVTWRHLPWSYLGAYPGRQGTSGGHCIGQITCGTGAIGAYGTHGASGALGVAGRNRGMAGNDGFDGSVGIDGMHGSAVG